MIFLKPFYDGNHFTSKQTKHKLPNGAQGNVDANSDTDFQQFII